MQGAINLLEIETQNVILDIIDPITDEPMGLQFELLSPSDPVLVRLEKKYRSDLRDAARKGKSTEAIHNAFEIDYPAAAIVNWHWNNATIGGSKPLAPIEFTAENVRAMLKAKKLDFIRRQVNEKLGDDGASLKL